MIHIGLTRTEAEAVIEALEVGAPKDKLLWWLLAAEVREAAGCVPWQRENVSMEEQARRLSQMKEACAAMAWEVPDWETPGERRARERDAVQP